MHHHHPLHWTSADPVPGFCIEQTDIRLNAASHLTGLQGLSQNAAGGLWTNKGAVTVCFEH